MKHFYFQLFLPIIFLIFLSISGCGKGTEKVEFQIPSPAIGGENMPVSVNFDLPEAFKNVASDNLSVFMKSKEIEGEEIPGQLVPTDNGRYNLTWIMPRLEAGKTTNWTAVLKKKKPLKIGFSWKNTPGKYLDLMFNGRKVMRYVYLYDDSTPEKLRATNKPFYHIYDGRGENFITNGPEGLYPHHRGIFIGWQKVECGEKAYNFWSMEEGVSQRHQKFLKQIAGPVFARTSAEIFWMDENDLPVIKEIRTATIYRQPSLTLVLMKFESQLTPVKCDVNLLGNAEHSGVQFRANNEVAQGYVQGHHEAVPENQVRAHYFFPADNVNPRKDVDLPWTALSYSLGGTKYNVEHINSPDNPKNTMYSAYRNYGRFGASFNKFLKKGETLNLKYYIWVSKGETPSRAIFQNKYQTLTTALKINDLH